MSKPKKQTEDVKQEIQNNIDKTISNSSGSLSFYGKNLTTKDLYELTDANVESIATAISATENNFKTLDLHDCGIGEKGLSKISKALKNQNCKLKEVIISGSNFLSGEEGIAELAEALKDENCKLETVNLYAQGWASHGANEIEHEGIIKLCEALKHDNCKVKEINLRVPKGKLDESTRLLFEAIEHPSCKVIKLTINEDKKNIDACIAKRSDLKTTHTSIIEEKDISLKLDEEDELFRSNNPIIPKKSAINRLNQQIDERNDYPFVPDSDTEVEETEKISASIQTKDNDETTSASKIETTNDSKVEYSWKESLAKHIATALYHRLQEVVNSITNLNDENRVKIAAILGNIIEGIIPSITVDGKTATGTIEVNTEKLAEATVKIGTRIDQNKTRNLESILDSIQQNEVKSGEIKEMKEFFRTVSRIIVHNYEKQFDEVPTKKHRELGENLAARIIEGLTNNKKKQLVCMLEDQMQATYLKALFHGKEDGSSQFTYQGKEEKLDDIIKKPHIQTPSGTFFDSSYSNYQSEEDAIKANSFGSRLGTEDEAIDLGRETFKKMKSRAPAPDPDVENARCFPLLPRVNNCVIS